MILVMVYNIFKTKDMQNILIALNFSMYWVYILA